MEGKTSSNQEEEEPEPERIDLELLAIGKKAGLTFAELNMMRVRDLLDYVNIITGNQKSKPRKAAQKDIDALLG